MCKTNFNNDKELCGSDESDKSSLFNLLSFVIWFFFNFKTTELLSSAKPTNTFSILFLSSGFLARSLIKAGF